MTLNTWKNMLFLVFVLIVCQATVDSIGESDISNVIFAGDDNPEDNVICTTEYPTKVNLSVVTYDSVDLEWELLSNQSFISGYQILFWEFTSSTYSNISLGMVSKYLLTSLRPYTYYYISVRGECLDKTKQGVASNRAEILTRSTYPSQAPVITNSATPYKGSMSDALIVWSQIPDDQWNGKRLNYVVVIVDITPGYSNEASHLAEVGKTTLIITDRTQDHTYLITVSANSSGGVGPASSPVIFTIEAPTPSSNNQPSSYVNYFYYVAAPAVFLLALCVTVFIILCKIRYEKKRKNIQFARDISTNIEDEKMGGFDTGFRMDSRNSQRNRPLPAYPQDDPHPRTPSVSSMNARLIEQTSPHQFQRGPSFSERDQFHHHHHQFHHQHPPFPHHHPDFIPLDSDPNHQFRTASITSPQVPQLSQPLSDLSSATPSSVFAESNIPHPEENLSSPNTPKAYEVPSDSKTCHQSASPVGSHTNTLPNPHRPHTATGMMASQPMISHHPHSSHSPISLAHSSTDVRTNHSVISGNRPPDVPPHRTNSSVLQPAQGHGNSSTVNTEGGAALSPGSQYPEMTLYSEIPNEPMGGSGTDFPKITPPADSTLGRSAPLPSVGNNSSNVSSDPYSDYSDIPAACGSPFNENSRTNLPTTDTLPQNGRGPAHQRHSSFSDSMSSFSTDSQSGSPNHSSLGVGGGNNHMRRIDSNRSGPSHIPQPDEHDYDEANSLIDDKSSTGMPRLNSKSNHIPEVKVPPESFNPTPYLSPVDIVASTNGHSPSD